MSISKKKFEEVVLANGYILEIKKKKIKILLDGEPIIIFIGNTTVSEAAYYFTGFLKGKVTGKELGRIQLKSEIKELIGL